MRMYDLWCDNAMPHGRLGIDHIRRGRKSSKSITLRCLRIPCTQNSPSILAFARTDTPDTLSRPTWSGNSRETHDCIESSGHRRRSRPFVPSIRDTLAARCGSAVDYCRDPIQHSTPKLRDTMNPARANYKVLRYKFYKIPSSTRSIGICWRIQEWILNGISCSQSRLRAVTHSSNTMNWFGVPSRIMRMCCNVGWHGATKFNRSWQFNVAGTDNKHNVFDNPSAISVRSLQNHFGKIKILCSCAP